MALISKADDLADFKERMENGGNRKVVCVDRQESLQEGIERTEAEVKIGLRNLRALTPSPDR